MHTNSLKTAFSALPTYSHLWLGLTYYNFYRLILVILCFTVAGLEQSFLGQRAPFLFTLTTAVYSSFAIVSLGCVFLKKPGFYNQVIIQIFIDIFAITILMFASGGPESGLGMLFITVVVAGGLFTPGKEAYLYAAIASIAILSEQLYTYLNLGIKQVTFQNAGILGITLFASAIVMSALSKRLGKTEALSKKQFEQLAKLEQLNALVIKKMQSGVMILDKNENILLMNQAAENLFSMQATHFPFSLQKLSKAIQIPVKKFIKTNPTRYTPTIELENKNKLKLNFVQIGQASENHILIFIEDMKAQFKKAQEMKLASLGRLTASIAHELRNPLGAISHAAQLLAETKQTTAPKARFTEIIQENTTRMDLIIKGVLALSREEKIQAKPLKLSNFIEKFCQDFIKFHPQKPVIDLIIDSPNTYVSIDANHLHQILTNLFENGIYYSLLNSQKPTLSIQTQRDTKNNLYYLYVMDDGKGVQQDNRPFLFEPFFTTQAQGIGLGLYLAQQLAHYHNASIEYLPAYCGKSCFRIHFTLDHEKDDEPNT